MMLTSLIAVTAISQSTLVPPSLREVRTYNLGDSARLIYSVAGKLIVDVSEEDGGISKHRIYQLGPELEKERLLGVYELFKPISFLDENDTVHCRDPYGSETGTSVDSGALATYTNSETTYSAVVPSDGENWSVNVPILSSRAYAYDNRSKQLAVMGVELRETAAETVIAHAWMLVDVAAGSSRTVGYLNGMAFGKSLPMDFDFLNGNELLVCTRAAATKHKELAATAELAIEINDQLGPELANIEFYIYRIDRGTVKRIGIIENVYMPYGFEFTLSGDKKHLVCPLNGGLKLFELNL